MEGFGIADRQKSRHFQCLSQIFCAEIKRHAKHQNMSCGCKLQMGCFYGSYLYKIFCDFLLSSIYFMRLQSRSLIKFSNTVSYLKHLQFILKFIFMCMKKKIKFLKFFHLTFRRQMDFLWFYILTNLNLKAQLFLGL